MVKTLPQIDLVAFQRRFGLDTGAHLIVVSAHPDDETIGCGRLIAGWTAVLGGCTAVLATLGEACVDDVMARPPGLAEMRLAEWVSATADLGVSSRHVLELPDGRLADWEKQLCDSVTEIAGTYAEELGPTRVLLAAPHPLDPHPDHEAAGRATVAAARRLGVGVVGYPVWLTYRGAVDARAEQLLSAPGAGVRLNVSEDAEAARRRALSRYVSQLAPLRPDVTAVVPADLELHHGEQIVLTAGRTLR